MIFSNSKQLICPYCMSKISYWKDINKCPIEGCKMELPKAYVDNFKTVPPVFTQMIGWEQVGKTVYLQALTMTLLNISKLWQRHYYPSFITQVTQNYERNVLEFQRTNTMPAPTQMTLQDAYIMQLHGMERWGSRTLVVRDVAGEHFKSLNFPTQYMPYLEKVPTTIMMISIPDMNDNEYAMNQLMDSYIQTMSNHKKDFKKNPGTIIVVLSKGDLIQNIMPTNIKSYLEEDVISAALNSGQSSAVVDGIWMAKYIEKMHFASQAIEDWLFDRFIDNTGHNMIQQARANRIKLVFSIVSSTGGKEANVDIQPKRVLDPFFWMLELQSKS